MIIVVMGVSGSGKTTIGQMLAEHLHAPFFDGDDYHPRANVAKMSRGIPLTDDDRASWLAALAQLIHHQLAQGQSAVLACSALKQTYRDHLRVDPAVRFVYLKGSYDLIRGRLSRRHGHYMQPALLQSQFAALEEPDDALIVDVAQSPEQIVDQIVQALTEKGE
ncbi:MAG TPA: gluconokinase [Anaerolineae bacterium]|nr:gluconokinase [Anaerolineae bacterium]